MSANDAGWTKACLTRRDALLSGAALVALPFGLPSAALAQKLSPDDARAIAREATVYGYPIVDTYRIQYSYFVDRNDPEFKGNWNEVHNTARVYTPKDTAIQTPNSDTPYSFVGADLRAEPLVFTVPAVDKERYYSLQFVDMYTFNFAYVGTRATGNDAGSFLLAGPKWKGEKPPGIKAVINSETDFTFVVYRTQLFNPGDIENVKKVQAGYRVEPLSKFLGQPAPAEPPAIDFVKPITADQERTSPEFFDIVDFVLQFCPIYPSETELRKRLAKLGIKGEGTFKTASLSTEMRKAVEEGLADGWKEFNAGRERFHAGEITSGDVFGTREYLKNNYLYRMLGAGLGIYGNSKQEAIYPSYAVDAEGQPPDGAHRYALRFAPGQLPPVDAFWSLTMYRMPESLLYANPINRYLINSPMLPDLKKDADGGVTIHVQNQSPGPDYEANWLPAPEGPFIVAMRLYLPKSKALDGTWKAPPLERVN